jgi:hypothetical protein
MSKKTLVFGLIAASVLSSAVVALPSSAEANRYGRYEDYRRGDRRSDWSELRRDRAELRRDQAELQRDRADLRRLYRNGASRAEIDRKKAEIRNDVREIRKDQREIREGYADIRRDRYDYDRYYNSPWWGWGNSR